MRRAVAVALWLIAAWWSFSTVILNNDHFGRISPARQIAVYGELPFRDFFDPAYFLTEFSSAAMMRLFGDNLLGEAVLTSTFIATGTVIVFLLATRAASSTLAGLLAAILALLTFPRAYDYDKVLFLPLGILLCWRYVDRPSARRVVWLAAGLVSGALFRYDTGVYIGLAAVTTMAVTHADDWRTLSRRLGTLIAAVALLSLPALVFLELNGGLATVIDQVVTYGRREAARTALTSPPWFSTGDRASSANALLYYLFRGLPLLAMGVLVASLRARGVVTRADAARLTGLVTMVVLLNLFIMRDPVSARFGGIAGPLAVLAAWLAGCATRPRSAPARVSLTAVVTVTLAATVWAVSVSADWQRRLLWDYAEWEHLTSSIGSLSASPPPVEMLEGKQFMELIRYLRECTSTHDRILATWFVPELYFFAQRGFAGGIVAMFGEHWTEPRFEARTLALMESQRALMVISRAGDLDYRHSYPELARYLDAHYRDAGTSDFGVPSEIRGYTILVRRDRQVSYVHQSSSLPCFW